MLNIHMGTFSMGIFFISASSELRWWRKVTAVRAGQNGAPQAGARARGGSADPCRAASATADAAVGTLGTSNGDDIE